MRPHSVSVHADCVAPCDAVRRHHPLRGAQAPRGARGDRASAPAEGQTPPETAPQASREAAHQAPCEATRCGHLVVLEKLAGRLARSNALLSLAASTTWLGRLVLWSAAGKYCLPVRCSSMLATVFWNTMLATPYDGCQPTAPCADHANPDHGVVCCACPCSKAACEASYEATREAPC